MGTFTKQEIKTILISIILLAVVFGLNDKREVFDIRYWLINFLMVIVIVAASLVLREYIRKFIAKKFHVETELEIWDIERFWFTKSSKIARTKKIQKFPMGIILPLLISLFSFGRIYVPLVNTVKIKEDTTRRMGKRFLHITEFETAVIILSGIMANLFLAFIFTAIGKESFSQLITINLWMALFSFVPLSDLDGTKIFFGSRTLYVAALAFTILFSALLLVVRAFSSVIVGVIGALIITLVYFYLLEFGRA